MNKAFFTLNFSLIVVFVLAGCASATGRNSYAASSWAPIESKTTDDGCPNLTGTYGNHGTNSYPVEIGEPPKLNDIFTRMGRGTGLMSPQLTKHAWPVPADAASVSIAQTPEVLTVTFIGVTGEKTSLPFRRYHFSLFEERYDDLFTCYDTDKEPRLRFFAEPENHSGIIPNLYSEGSGTLIFLLKASDGSLIVQWRKETFSALITIVGSGMTYETVWWLYPALSGAIKAE